MCIYYLYSPEMAGRPYCLYASIPERCVANKLLHVQLISFLRSYLVREDHQWILWTPVCLGLGVAWYFSLSKEPSVFGLMGWSSLIIGFSGLLWWWGREKRWVRRCVIGILLVLLGFQSSFWRTYTVNPLMLPVKLGPLYVEGSVDSLEHMGFAGGSVTSYRLVLSGLKSPDFPYWHALPRKVRLTFNQGELKVMPGQRLRAKVMLTPVPDPPFPGGYHFRRQLFFQGIGATGFILAPPQSVTAEPSVTTLGHVIQRVRQRLNQLFYTHLKAPLGSLAAALVTGETTTISPEQRMQFTQAGLAHMLAISGLHLSIIAGLFFFLFQGCLALVPRLVLYYPLHKIAAFFSLLGTGIYLSISGAGIPAQRSFLMTGFVMLAIMLDRHPFTLRTVALAATAVLLVRPESLLSVSFQLSFAAVTALVTVYEQWTLYSRRFLGVPSVWKKGVIYVAGSCLSSIVAMIATTPFALAVFHVFTVQGIVANMLAIPLLTFWIMPLAVLTCLFYPLGWSPFAFLGKGLAWLVSIVTWTSTWPGSAIPVSLVPWWVLPWIALGGLWVCIWRSPLRWLGVIPWSVGLFGCFINILPDVWVDGGGKVMGYLDHSRKILWVSSLKKGTFVTDAWLKAANLKEKRLFPYAGQCGALNCGQDACWVPVGRYTIGLLPKGMKKNVLPQLDSRTVLMSLEPLKVKGALVVDWFDLWRHGSHGVTVNNVSVTVQTTRQDRRPWTHQAISRKNWLRTLSGAP